MSYSEHPIHQQKSVLSEQQRQQDIGPQNLQDHRFPPQPGFVSVPAPPLSAPVVA
jgi:hypothetical protein